MTRALKAVPGVSDVSVNLGEKTATVTHAGANVDAMKEKVEDAGYDVVGVQ